MRVEARCGAPVDPLVVGNDVADVKVVEDGHADEDPHDLRRVKQRRFRALLFSSLGHVWRGR